MQRVFVVLSIGLLCVAGCRTTGPSVPVVHSDSVSEKDAALLGAISELAGEWEMADENGVKQPAATFAVTAAGSAVREIMFPGQAQEMTNLYHMDGAVLVCTHYCAGGNQPRMVAASARMTDEGTEFRFELESVTNLRASHDHYMGDMTLTLLEDGRVRQDWRSYDREGKLSEPVTFLLERKGT